MSLAYGHPESHCAVFNTSVPLHVQGVSDSLHGPFLQSLTTYVSPQSETLSALYT